MISPNFPSGYNQQIMKHDHKKIRCSFLVGNLDTVTEWITEFKHLNKVDLRVASVRRKPQTSNIIFKVSTFIMRESMINY